MISINLPNVITIGVISILVYAGAKAGLKVIGYQPTWL